MGIPWDLSDDYFASVVVLLGLYGLELGCSWRFTVCVSWNLVWTILCSGFSCHLSFSSLCLITCSSTWIALSSSTVKKSILWSIHRRRQSVHIGRNSSINLFQILLLYLWIKLLPYSNISRRNSHTTAPLFKPWLLRIYSQRVSLYTGFLLRHLIKLSANTWLVHINIVFIDEKTFVFAGVLLILCRIEFAIILININCRWYFSRFLGALSWWRMLPPCAWHSSLLLCI